MVDSTSWVAIYPEIALLVMGCVIALVDLGVRCKERIPTHVLTLLTLAVVAAMQAAYALRAETVYAWGNMLVSDSMGNWLKFFVALAMIFTLTYARPYAAVRGMLRGGELYTLSIFSTLGMFVMISANNLLLLYLGLELLTLSSYALVALRRDDNRAIEAAMKYFVLGSMASGFLLYGLSMIYGATATLDIDGVFYVISTGEVSLRVLVFGLVFVVAGLAFKLGAVPFHMWVPDVYHGAPTAITALIGGAPKLAAFAIVMRLLVEGLQPLAVDWQQMLALLAIASLLLGNLAAIAQANIKRMLAYSTISHMGFVLLGLMAGILGGVPDEDRMAAAYSATMFYVVTYVLTALASFGVIMLLSRDGFESEEIADFAGLNQRSPLYAAVMAVCLFSMAGIPPLVGFDAKLTILQALVSTGAPLYIGLAVFAVVMSLIGAFYYIRVFKVMYFDKPVDDTPVQGPFDVRAVLTVNGALVLLLGLFPGALMALCADAVKRALLT